MARSPRAAQRAPGRRRPAPRRRSGRRRRGPGSAPRPPRGRTPRRSPAPARPRRPRRPRRASAPGARAPRTPPRRRPARRRARPAQHEQAPGPAGAAGAGPGVARRDVVRDRLPLHGAILPRAAPAAAGGPGGRRPCRSGRGDCAREVPGGGDDEQEDHVGEQLRLMAVHAHPDDESSKGAATMARYVAEGVEVMVVSCTGGERGDVLNPRLQHDPEVQRDIVGFRRKEMAEAVRILGVQHRWLGFVDSGLPEGDPLPPLPDGCFALEPLEIAAAPLVRLVREFRPHVMTTYDEDGGYPHPDHIMCHKVSLEAFEAAGDPDRYVGHGAVPVGAAQAVLQPDLLPGQDPHLPPGPARRGRWSRRSRSGWSGGRSGPSAPSPPRSRWRTTWTPPTAPCSPTPPRSTRTARGSPCPRRRGARSGRPRSSSWPAAWSAGPSPGPAGSPVDDADVEDDLFAGRAGAPGRRRRRREPRARSSGVRSATPAAGLRLSPSPVPGEVVRTPDPDLVTPGTLGFLAIFAVAVALVLPRARHGAAQPRHRRPGRAPGPGPARPAAGGRRTRARARTAPTGPATRPEQPRTPRERPGRDGQGPAAPNG